MVELVRILQQLGFGEYEARAYVALVQRSPVNGYELAKASGVPRPNIYGVLQKLEERGSVLRLDTPAGARYAPVAPQELVAGLARQFQQAAQAAGHALSELARPAEHDYVWSATGHAALLEQARAVLATATEEVLVAAQPPEARSLAGDFAGVEARGVKVTTLCLEACASECGGCRGDIYRVRLAPDDRSRWLVVVADGRELTAAVSGDLGDSQAVRTRLPLMVQLASMFIRHSIALAAVLTELGARLEQSLGSEVQSTLASLGSGDRRLTWLDQLRRMMSRRSETPS